MSAGPKNYTTMISTRQTAQECIDLLADAGADHIALTMAGRQPSGLSFRLDTPMGPRDFRLPVNAAGMHKRLRRADFSYLHTTAAKIGTWRSEEHAHRVAWRVCRDWLDATVALVLAEMADMSEAFAAYRILDGGRAVYEMLAEADTLALPAGTGEDEHFHDGTG